MRKNIVERVKIEGQAATRKLECGHITIEPKGSKAKDAKWADCKVCDTAEVVTPAPTLVYTPPPAS